MFAYTEFLSHTGEYKENLLGRHLHKVAYMSREIFSDTKFPNKELVFYSGLLHDIGKINPWYQEIFRNNSDTTKQSLTEYVQEHSRFSAWAAKRLLRNIGLNDDMVDKILVLIYCHHSSLRRSLGKIEPSDKIKHTQNAIDGLLKSFHSSTSKIDDLVNLNWDVCFDKFSRTMDFDMGLNSEKSPDDYLEMSCAFSCLLQADRGSFASWNKPSFDLNLALESMTRDCTLHTFRERFQKHVMKKFDPSVGITVINAPTGIGKTKVFLDLINRHYSNNSVERVFYFSPLLALTEDFERKIMKIAEKSKTDLNDILVYNHIFSDTLENRGNENVTNKWMFENESFNKKFIITTTQRLLMTIYSNTARDKMKFASFKNSVLIIDEIQTIPKPILANLRVIFEKMNQYMNTRFILVSATVPNEISKIKRIHLPKELLDGYMDKTKKTIEIGKLDFKSIPIKKTLIMANTRRKAVCRYQEIVKNHPGKEIMYLTTGIRKKDRASRIESLSKKSGFALVSTQIVEAGVDIDFSHVFREEAPLDNIIQVMGRLNREGDSPDAKLSIYRTDGKPTPYSQLEFDITLERIRGISDSVQLYGILDEYYKEISRKNRSNEKVLERLKNGLARLDFKDVWSLVRDTAFEENNRDTVIVPDLEKWDTVREELLQDQPHDRSNKIFKKFSEYTASLPTSWEKMGKNQFDESLIDRNILLPKKEHLGKIYDKNLGLDVWFNDDVK